MKKIQQEKDDIVHIKNQEFNHLNYMNKQFSLICKIYSN